MEKIIGQWGTGENKDKDRIKNVVEKKILFLLFYIFPIVCQKFLRLVLELNT